MMRLLTACVLAAAASLAGAQAEDGLRFLVLGDWGAPGTQQTAVAQQLANVAKQVKPQFLLAAGDNFYEQGVKSVDDPQWEHTFKAVYSDPALQLPWYALLGNHDYVQNPQAQIQYSQQRLDARWNMPDTNYTQAFAVASGVTLQLVVIDTVALSASTVTGHMLRQAQHGKLTETVALGALRQVHTASRSRASQLQWLEQVLASSTADWLVVAGHYPVYSAGEHGNTAELLTDVLPLLKKYDVDAYICGHDHTMQHLQDSGVHFFLSGAGAKRGTVGKIPQLVYGSVEAGFSVHTVTPSNMHVQYVGTTGNTMYAVDVPRKRNLPGLRGGDAASA